MKKWVKYLACAMVLVVSLSACTPTSSNSKETADISGTILGPVQNSTAKIAFFALSEQYQTEEGQEIWSLITRFSGEKGVASNMYTVTEKDFETTVELAKKSGVELIVLWGDAMGEQLQKNMPLPKDLSFILLDAEQEWDLGKNVVVQMFSPQQKGWLAGYLAVKNGEANLACLSLPEQTKEQTENQLGFLLGAQAASEELQLPEKAVRISLGKANSEQSVLQQLEQFASEGVKTVYVPAGQAQLDEIQALPLAQQFSYIFAEKEPGEELRPQTIFAIDEEIEAGLTSLLYKWNMGEIPLGQVLWTGMLEQAFSFSVANAWAQVSAEEQMLAAIDCFTQQNSLQKLEDQISVPYAQNGVFPLPNELVLSGIEVLIAPLETGNSASVPYNRPQLVQPEEPQAAAEEIVQE